MQAKKRNKTIKKEVIQIDIAKLLIENKTLFSQNTISILQFLKAAVNENPYIKDVFFS